VSPFGTRDSVFFGVVEWRAVPAVEIARRCNVRSFAVEGVTFSQPPMSGNAIAIDAETGGSGLDDEAVVLKFAEPASHRPDGIGAEIAASIAAGSENLPIVQVVVPQIASQRDVQGSRAK